MKRTVILLALALVALLCGCATPIYEPIPGATGDEPFEQSLGYCKAFTPMQPGGVDFGYQGRFEACMASRGWRRAAARKMDPSIGVEVR